MAYLPVPNYPFFDNGVTTTRDVSQLDANFLYVSGKFVSVKDYGAIGDGVIDDTAAIQGALNAAPAGATVVMPPGTYRVSTVITVPSGVQLVGLGIGSNIFGGYVEIIGDLSVSPIVTVTGGAGSHSSGIRSLSISRGSGAIPASSIGLLIQSTDSAVIEDIQVYRSDIGVKITGQLGISLTRVQTSTITGTHLWLENAFLVKAISCQFGRNGGQDVNGNEYVRIKGNSDTMHFTQCQFNAPGATLTRAIYFDTYSSVNGILSFSQCHFEGVGADGYFAQTGTTSVTRISVHQCTLNSITPFAGASLPSGFFTSLVVVGCPSIAGALTLTAATSSVVTGNKIDGAVSLAGGSGVFSSNTVASTLSVSGACTGMMVTGNVLTSASAVTNTATGQYVVAFNLVNDATLNAQQDGYQRAESTHPVPVPGSGAFTSAGATLDYTKEGNRVFYNGVVSIITNGTAGTYIKVPLPFTPAVPVAGSGFDSATNNILVVEASTDGFAYIFSATGTYPGANGKNLYFSGSYRV